MFVLCELMDKTEQKKKLLNREELFDLPEPTECSTFAVSLT